MRTRSQSRNLNRQQQQAPPAFVEPFNLEEPIENPAPPVVTMDDNRTMAQLLEAPTKGYEDAIVVPEITADNFELKHGLLTLVQNKQFFGHDKEDPHAHIRYFNKITSTMKFPNVPTWDRFNDLLRACPHHGFSELHQLDTFYNALNSNDQDSLNSAVSGNFLDKMPRDCLRIIKSKAKVRNSRNKPVVAKVSLSTSTSGISPDVAELKDMVKALLLDKKNQSPAPTPIKRSKKVVLLAVVLIRTEIAPPPMATFIVTIFKSTSLKPPQLTTTKEIPVIEPRLLIKFDLPVFLPLKTIKTIKEIIRTVITKTREISIKLQLTNPWLIKVKSIDLGLFNLLLIKLPQCLGPMSFDDTVNKLQVTEVKTDEPKALVSVDSMVNWSDHAAENKTGEVEKVYGMMAGLHADNSGAGVSDATAEFAMMGISPKVQNCPLGCDSKINDLNNMYNNLDRLYNDCYIKVQAYQNAVKTLESQKDWYNKTQIALEEKIRILSANLENTTNTLSYTEKLHDQAQKEKKEWEVKFEATLARFEKWKESSKNLKKLINSSMSTRTKIGLGFKEYFGKDEVFDLSTPSVFYPEPVEEDKPLYSWFVKAGEMHAVPPSITGTYMPTPYKSDIEETQVSYGSKSDNKTSETLSESNDFVSCDNSDKSSDSETYASCDSSLKTKTNNFPPAVDITTLPESDIEDPNSTTGSPSFSCLENVKSPRIFCNKSGMNNRNVCKNNSVRVKKCFVCGSKLHLIKDCDFYNCVDSVPCKSKAASVSAGSRNSPASVPAGRSDSAASRNRPAVNSAGRPNPAGRSDSAASRNRPAVNSAGGPNPAGRSDSAASRNRPAVNSAGGPNPAGWSKRPATVSAGRPVSAGWLNPAARPYFRPSSVYFNNQTNFYDPMFMDKGRWDTAGDPSTDNDIGIVDSGCSRSMTGNKEKLADFVPIKGGIVKFGGGDGRISGKGTIRTSKLDFENVYYVEELYGIASVIFYFLMDVP
ncbi:hypothetical protein Tco_0668577 [Tanacetum coccineum]